MKTVKLKLSKKEMPMALATLDNMNSSVNFIETANKIIDDAVKRGKTSACIQISGSVPPKMAIETFCEAGYDIAYMAFNRIGWKILILWDTSASGKIFMMEDPFFYESSIDEMYGSKYITAQTEKREIELLERESE